MRAVVFRKYGTPDVLHVEEIERPTPKENEVLVKVKASTVTRSDTGLRSSEYFFARIFTGLFRPKRTIAGMEFAGVVEEVGAAVTNFRVADEVFGIEGGANAEYICVGEGGLIAHKPTGMTFEEAAAVCDGALLALTCLKPAERRGQSIVVYGASGSIGTAAVQLARYFEADVTAVCNTKNLEFVRSLGANEVVDYLTEDFTKNGKEYDVVFDSVGKHSFRRCRHSLKPGGIYISADLGFMWHVPILALLTRWIGKKKARLAIGRYRREDLLLIKELIEAGKYRAVIDRSYPLEDVVEATRYVETEQKTGNVVLTLVVGRVP
ncbi:MAG: NAD(P)-dependent alcohol dehydrogenase [Candidatus Nanopelagicaceae bacterium]|nr:NAD(P)-dependent alcohol dehydrogenase [Candidatus Nanopelagicaceae bacterium]